MLDFTYVDDCVNGIASGIDILVSDKDKNHTINLAYGEGRSLVDMANYIGDTLGLTPNMTVEPSRIGEVTHYVADIAKARELLNYTPSTSLKQGIQKAIKWSIGYNNS